MKTALNRGLVGFSWNFCCFFTTNQKYIQKNYM